MAVAVYNWTWQQGDDLVMTFIYKEGPSGSEVPVDLTGFSLRMDIVQGATRLYTFNSADITDVDPGGPVLPDTNKEAVLASNGTVTITVPRSLTLPGGSVNAIMTSGNTVVNYDIFLRNASGKQAKILRGTITIEPSYTLWL